MKRILLNSFLYGSIILASSSCMNRHVLPAYYERATNHHIIALLPVHIENSPTNEWTSLTSEAQQQSISFESSEFQEIAYNSILRKLGKRQFDIKVDIQSSRVSNGRLKGVGVDFSNINEQDPMQLGSILNVDAVLLVHFTKDIQLNTDAPDQNILASDQSELFIEEGEEDDINALQSEESLDKKYNVHIRAELIDTRDGSLLWHFARSKKKDISYPLDRTIDDLTRTMIRKFPYKNFKDHSFLN